MKRNYGLAELPPDERDFQLGAIDDLPKLEDLPANMELPFIVKNQGTTDWCSAYATCAASEVQEGTELEPGFNFAVSKMLQGNVDSWGCDLRTACKSHVKYGAIPVDLVQESTKRLTNTEKRDYDNWERYVTPAAVHKKRSYFKITGPYDAFDNVRASLFKYQTPIVIGIQFGYPLTQIHFATVKPGFGHAMPVIGWTTYDNGEPVLIVGNSYGDQAGITGRHYISRTVINTWVDKYGAFTFLDLDPETVKYNLEKGIRLRDNWIVQLWKTLRVLFR